MNRDVGWLAQSRTTETLLRQLSVTYPLGTRGVTYLITHHIMLFRNLTRMRELLLVVRGNLLLIIPILHPILSIPTLLSHQALLAGLLGIVGGIDGRGIISNSTQSLSIGTGMRKRPGDVVVEDIESTPPLRPGLLESSKSVMENYPWDRKTHLDATAALGTHATITRTEGIRPYAVCLVAGLQDPLIRFLVFRGCAGKVIQAGPAPVAGQWRLGFHMQRQGQDTLRNLLRRAVGRGTKRHIELLMKKKKILMIYRRYVQNWTKVDDGGLGVEEKDQAQ